MSGVLSSPPHNTVEELACLESQLAARTPEAMPKPGLERIRALIDMLGSPQHFYPVVHITGTNGKTTTARMVDALLRATGMRTGRYTSPHLESVIERIAVDNEPLTPERFIAAYQDVAPYVDMADMRPVGALSFFEVLTGMAYAAFADAPVDVAVVEVGLGGCWDATNVADGQVAVVTPISIDHTRALGNTVAEIAQEKAGIIKPGAVAVLAQQPWPATDVLRNRATTVDATVVQEGNDFAVARRAVAVGGQTLTIQGLTGQYKDLFLPLHGAHQAHNAVCALAAVEAFLGSRTSLDEELVREAFAGVTSPGRLEVLRRNPTVVLDGAHNLAGAQAAAAALREAFAFKRVMGVLGVSSDKDARGILAAFEPVLTEIVVTQNSWRRAMPADHLASIAVEVFGPDRVRVAPRLAQALRDAVQFAETSDQPAKTGIVVTGSIITAGEARQLLRKNSFPGVER